MKRRTFLGGALTSLVAGLVPASVLSQAVALHKVKINVEQDEAMKCASSMSIDGGPFMPLQSVVISLRHKGRTIPYYEEDIA